jgi:hypothetical protein
MGKPGPPRGDPKAPFLKSANLFTTPGNTGFHVPQPDATLKKLKMEN